MEKRTPRADDTLAAGRLDRPRFAMSGLPPEQQPGEGITPFDHDKPIGTINHFLDWYLWQRRQGDEPLVWGQDGWQEKNGFLSWDERREIQDRILSKSGSEEDRWRAAKGYADHDRSALARNNLAAMYMAMVDFVETYNATLATTHQIRPGEQAPRLILPQKSEDNGQALANLRSQLENNPTIQLNPSDYLALANICNEAIAKSPDSEAHVSADAAWLMRDALLALKRDLLARGVQDAPDSV